MSTDPGLDQLSREELVKRALALGARRPEVMTRVELRDEIVRLSESDPLARRRSRGWLGVARDLVASVMDAGLNMPAAAKAIRGDARPAAEETTGPPPVATLTLAEIYLAQGHADRALSTLEEVLATEPEHAAALALRDRIMNEQTGPAARRRAPPSEPSGLEEPLPAPAPFIGSAQSSVITSEPAPDAIRSPIVPSHFAEARPSAEPPFGESPGFAESLAYADPPRENEAPPFIEEPPFVDAMPPAQAPLAAPEPAPAPEPRDGPAFQLLVEPEAPVEPAGTPAIVVEPAPDSEITQTSSAVPVSQPVPTLAAPPPAEDDVAEPPSRPECVLVERHGSLEGFYALPPGASGIVLRVAWFVPALDGPIEGQVDVPLDPVQSRIALPPVDEGARVRAALGTGVGGRFRPLAVAWVYRAEERGLAVAFAAPGHEPIALRAQAQGFAGP